MVKKILVWLNQQLLKPYPMLLAKAQVAGTHSGVTSLFTKPYFCAVTKNAAYTNVT